MYVNERRYNLLVFLTYELKRHLVGPVNTSKLLVCNIKKQTE